MGNNGKQEELEDTCLSLMLSFERRQYNITERYWHIGAAVTTLFNSENQYEMINQSCKSLLKTDSTKTISRKSQVEYVRILK